MQVVTGIKICNDWLRQLVQAEGFVSRRPKHTLKGKQMRVPSHGVNGKHTVFGAFYYGDGLFSHHTQPCKTA